MALENKMVYDLMVVEESTWDRSTIKQYFGGELGSQVLFLEIPLRDLLDRLGWQSTSELRVGFNELYYLLK